MVAFYIYVLTLNSRNEHRNSILMTRHHLDWVCLLLAEANFPCSKTNEKLYNPDLGSHSSSVWNFSARFSEVILRGNLWFRHELSAVVRQAIFVLTCKLKKLQLVFISQWSYIATHLPYKFDLKAYYLCLSHVLIHNGLCVQWSVFTLKQWLWLLLV